MVDEVEEFSCEEVEFGDIDEHQNNFSDAAIFKN
jgi:hypothetical protein